MKEKLTRNVGVKILSILIATILWIIITNVDDPIESKKFPNVPVTILNEKEIISPNRTYEIEVNKTINFTVSARKSIIDNLTQADFRVTADFALLSDVYATNIDIECPNPKYQDEIVITDGKDQKMKITPEELLSKNFKIKVEPGGEVVEGYDVGEATSSPNIIRITGPKKRVESIDQVIVQVDVTGVTGVASLTGRPKLFDKNGEEIDASKLSYSINYVTVNLELYKTKKINLNITTTGEPAYGYAVSNVEYEPKQIVVSGRDSDLAAIKELTIVEDISGINGNIEKQINIKDYLQQGIHLVEEDETAVINITVEKLDTKDLTILPYDIEVRNMPNDLNFAFNTASPMTVKVMGPSKDLVNLTKSTLKPFIDLSNYHAGIHTTNIKFDQLEYIVLSNIPIVTFELSW